MHETPSLTVDCVVFHSDGVVLIRRGFKPFKGSYALPGGFVDIGETAEMACVRELKEETGLEIDTTDLRLIGVYSDPNRDPRKHSVSIAFLGQSNLDMMEAGDDAVSVEIVKNWKDEEIAFDHKMMIIDAWSLHSKIMKT